MKTCSCGKRIPTWVKVAGKRRNLKNRTKCFDCSPFKSAQERNEELSKRTKKLKTQKWYQATKERLGIDPITLRRETRRKHVIELIGNVCQACGYDRCRRNMAFHHLHGKRHELSSREFQNSLTGILAELKKCVLLCHNCHGEAHDGILAQDRLLELNANLIRSLSVLEGKSWADVVSYPLSPRS